MKTSLETGLVFAATLLLCAGLLAGPGCGSSSGPPGGDDPGPSTNANLASLDVSTGTLSPAFDPPVIAYTVGPCLLDATVTCTPTAEDAGATITVDGVATPSGTASAPIPLPVGPTPVAVVVTAADATTQKTYTVVFTRAAPSAQQAYIKASNTDWGDWFGMSVAISGDTLAVGASLESSGATGVGGDETDNSAINSGAVYVYTRDGATWSQQAYIKASNTDAGDQFGYSVALSGDTLVVGACTEDSNATGVNSDESNNTAANSGAAYVFR